MMTQEAKKTVGYYLMLRTVSAFGISLIAATYVTFLIGKGLNLFQVNLVNFVFFWTLFVFEIPTGAFADVFGRKLSFVLSCILFSGGMFLYAAAHSFWGFALAEAVSAVGATFASGAFQAWLVDRLRHQGYEGPLGKVFAWEQQIRSGVGVLAAMLGAYAAEKNSSLPWFCGGWMFLAAAALAVACMKEEQFVRQKFSWKGGAASMAAVVRTSARYAKTNSAVRFIVVMGVVQFFAIQAPNMQWQPFFSRFLRHKSDLGFVYAGISIALIIGSRLAPPFLKRIGSERMALAVTQAAIGFGICVTIFCGNLFAGLAVFWAHEVARGMFVPVEDAYLNDNIPSGERATLISFESISHHVGGMAGLLVSGFIAQYCSMTAAWVLSGTVLVASGVVFLKNGRK
jgi:MFS family permease